MEERIIKDINNLLTQLFQKMKEAGYEWNAEKKELRKIEQKPSDEIGNYDHGKVLDSLMSEKKTPAWSERDELMLEASISFIKSSPYPYFGDTLRGEISKIEAENWIKYLKKDILGSQVMSRWMHYIYTFIILSISTRQTHE